jgi:hypothetical protein
MAYGILSRVSGMPLQAMVPPLSLAAKAGKN